MKTSRKKLLSSRRNWKKAMAAIAAKPKQRVTLTCKTCEKEYQVEPYREHTSKYCCWNCGQKGKAQAAAKIQIAKRGTGLKHRYVKFFSRHQHRVVAEQMLGRPLVKGEVVHHIDGNGKNNSPSNLMVITQSEHVKMHHKAMMAARKEKCGY